MIWLNPLLRFEGFEPKAAGIRALLPEVTLHLPAHNLDSLGALVALLAAPPPPRPQAGGAPSLSMTARASRRPSPV